MLPMRRLTLLLLPVAWIAASCVLPASAATPDQDTAAERSAQQADAPSQPESQSGAHGFHLPFSRLFGRRIPRPTTMSGTDKGGTIDCAQIASMPNATVSREDCQKMLDAQQTYQAAANDPSAARPGDAQMTCEQIMAELRQQRLSAPDRAAVAQATTAVADKQALLAKQQAEMARIGAQEQAKVSAAEAADRATQIATAGLVQGHATDAAATAAQQRVRREGERMMKESKSTNDRLLDSTANLATEMTRQVQSNPRAARLMQLANARGCRGG